MEFEPCRAGSVLSVYLSGYRAAILICCVVAEFAEIIIEEAWLGPNLSRAYQLEAGLFNNRLSWLEEVDLQVIQVELMEWSSLGHNLQ
jgi:hypothetical protein